MFKYSQLFTKWFSAWCESWLQGAYSVSAFMIHKFMAQPWGSHSLCSMFIEHSDRLAGAGVRQRQSSTFMNFTTLWVVHSAKCEPSDLSNSERITEHAPFPRNEGLCHQICKWITDHTTVPLKRTRSGSDSVHSNHSCKQNIGQAFKGLVRGRSDFSNFFLYVNARLLHTYNTDVVQTLMFTQGYLQHHWQTDIFVILVKWETCLHGKGHHEMQ